MIKKNIMICIDSIESFDKEVLNSDIPVMVEFKADWNGGCQIIAPAIEKLLDNCEDRIKFCFVNIDKSSMLAEMYGIAHVPTMLFFRDGQVIDHIIGTVPKKVLEKKLTGLLG